jgi:hypothetical protein
MHTKARRIKRLWPTVNIASVRNVARTRWRHNRWVFPLLSYKMTTNMDSYFAVMHLGDCNNRVRTPSEAPLPYLLTSVVAIRRSHIGPSGRLSRSVIPPIWGSAAVHMQMSAIYHAIIIILIKLSQEKQSNAYDGATSRGPGTVAPYGDVQRCTGARTVRQLKSFCLLGETWH